MKGAQGIFRFLLDAQQRGERTALITITTVIGSSSRAPGTHMAVSETGSFAGSFSGGCVEAAVVGEALRIIASGRAEIIRFGQGSPFIDIRLPCGGGLDILVTPNPAVTVLLACCEALTQRHSIALHCDRGGGLTVRPSRGGEQTGWQDDLFVVRHDPEMRLLIVGHGAETESLTHLALSFGAEVCVLSPDADLVMHVRALGAEAQHLKTATRSNRMQADPHTAVVMLFHDHDWEIELLAQALELEAFFIGDMGSCETHRRRIALLEDHGVAASATERITAPIGLIPATRDPQTLALSTLSQIAGCYGERLKSKSGERGTPPLRRFPSDQMHQQSSIAEVRSPPHQVFGA